MLIYVLAFAFCILVLVAAFRSMGGETVGDAAATEFIDRMVGWVVDESDAVAALGRLRADAPPPPELSQSVFEDRVRAARKALSGYQQQLTRFEVADPTGRAQRVRVLLSTAIESLGWACRMSEAGNLAGNPGVRTAVADLHAHAAACLNEAGELVAEGVVEAQ